MQSRIPYYLFAAIVVFFGWQKYRQKIEQATSGDPSALADMPVERSAESAFRCDGRTRCPEMRSCEEALYFLRNCPGTKMDGDGDGVPCEDQWCSHLR